MYFVRGGGRSLVGRRAALSRSVAAVFGIWSAGCGTPFQAREQVTLTAPLPAQRLIVRNRVGDVVLHADPDATEVTAEVVKIGKGVTQAEADKALEQIRVTVAPKPGDPDTLLADVDHPAYSNSRRYEVEWRVTAPAALASEVHLAVGELHVRGFTGGTVLHCSVGDIVTLDLAGSLRAWTSTGDIRAEAAGAVDLSSGVGDIRLRLLPGEPAPVTVRSDVGDIRLRIPTDRTGRLVADTGIGSLDVRLEDLPMRVLRQRPNHFDVQLGQTTDPLIDLTSGIGDVVITTYPAKSPPAVPE
jgi:hypothetical protein